MDQFISRLRKQAENCNWENAEEPIRDQVNGKCRSSKLRRKLLIKGTDLTIAKLQEITRSFEAVDIQLKAVCGEGKQAYRVYQKKTADQCKSRGRKGRC